MPRRLRFIPSEGSVVEVTTRTIQGRLLLRPSHRLNMLILGVLGRAQRLYGMRIHDLVFLSNHYHLLLSVDSSFQLARFMGYLNSNLAREVARLTGWHDKVWSRRYQVVLVSEESAAQIARLRYILAHGVKEDLVASPLDWPGVASVKAHLRGDSLTGLWLNRTKAFWASRNGEDIPDEDYTEEEQVHLTPLPCWQELSQSQRRAFIRELVTEIEEEAAKRRLETGKQLLGQAAVLQQHTSDVPVASKRSPAPFAHCASTQAGQSLWQAYSWFLGAYLDAREALRAGRSVVFPEGSFPPPAPFVTPLLEPG